MRPPIPITLTATGRSAQGRSVCFGGLNLGDGTSSWGGPEDMPSGFVGGSATLATVQYSKGGTYTLTVTPRQHYENHSQNPFLAQADDEFYYKGVQPCDGSASATVTVWDPYSVHHPVNLHVPPGAAALKGPSKPGGGPVEATKLNPGAAVALNPQPLPPGPMHTESLQTGAGATGENTATMLKRAPLVRSVSLTPSPVHEGQPVQIAIDADPGCTAVLINWGDGTTVDQPLAPHGRPLERPIQHVYRTMGAKTVKASGEHGCMGAASAALNVTIPVVRPVGSTVQAVHH